MTLNAQKLEVGLLAHNFFPRVAKRGDEFPPCFVSGAFTPAIASKLNSLPVKRTDGFGAIAARATRYDLAPRNMEISHPRAFAAISRHLKTSWNEWKPVLSNPSSAIRVSEHDDGRVFSMITSHDWESLVKPDSRFRAQVDVTNFYGSIYTHAFPWAVHGLPMAKVNRDDKSDWVNRLDSVLRQARRRETTGISTGPGTSAVAGEILLSQVDHALRKRGFDFVRYIDDYVFVAANRDCAEAFVSAVRDELAQLKLSIHPGKTSIREMPLASSPRWMRHFRSALRGPNTLHRILDALDDAIDLAASDNEDGVLRYVLVAIEEALAEDSFPQHARGPIVDRLLHIGFLRPIAIGTACRLLAVMGVSEVQARESELNVTLREHANALRTDAATWVLHTLLTSGISPSKAAADSIVQARDCLMMALLAEDASGLKSVSGFIEILEEESPTDYRRDEYWLIYYQFALRGKRWSTVPQSFYAEFEPLLDDEVSFVDLSAVNPYKPFHKAEAPRRLNGGGISGRGPYSE
ncbi:hypothetical protein J2X01_002885 [Arthrobacter ginsengisoli]|uniref:Reverse transcriptase domain-containing protein n=1 Tax=Arthrobacter ginsengisoli TaxID=1356565 RepID=A0ABU1UER6_9MICC|nr:RNA-directed DNA polymerase [Arthrobacter ginsengisoli]MDR7083590.1 hypothetical protein [Arthrobacter ginsengisoli]